MRKRTLLTVLCSVVCAIATLCFFGNVKTTARAETVSEVTIDWRGSYDGSTTMDYFYLGFAGFNTKDDYGGVAVSDYVFQNVKLNGVSFFEINSNTDVTDWVWDTFPQNQDHMPEHKKPILGYSKEADKARLQFRIHKNVTDEFLARDGYLRITVCDGFTLNGYVVDGETTFAYNGSTFEKVVPSVDFTANLSTHDWIKQSELNVTYLEVGEGVMPAGIDYGFIDAGYKYAQEYILINGRSVKEINEDTSLGAKDWTYTVFPATASDTYKIPVILFGKETSIEIKIHDEYLKLLGNKVEITAKAGLYFESNGKKYENSTDKTFTVWEQVVIVENDITESVSINGWHTAGDRDELSYAIISFEQGILSDDIGYGIIDNAKYQYLQEYITVNGKTVAEINTQTDTSSYEFSTFPSTTGAPFNVPVVIFENGDTLEVKVHNDYIASLGGNVDVTIGIKAGAYFAESETVKNVVKSDVQELVRRKEYTLTLINGDSRAEISLAHGSAINLEDQVRAGYTFEGWLEYETDSAVLATMPERDYTVYAVYTAIEYTVTFVADGETVATKTYTVENLAVEEPAVPEKAHYTGAWEEYTLDLNNLTVTAIYTAIEYTVTFVAGEETVATKTYTVENVQIEEPTVPEKAHYTGAWEEYTLTTGNVTVNAIYTAIEYTVTFVADGETVATKTYTVENVTVEEPAVPEKEGYTGAWEEYELDFSDITVEAVYTAVEQPESEPESEIESAVESAPNSQPASETASKGGSGCMGSISGSAIGLLGLIGVIFIRKKKD